MRIILKRYFCMMLAALMLTAIALPAAKAESEWPGDGWTTATLSVNPFATETKVYIVSNTLKAYKSASTSSRVLGTMSYGERMTLIDFSGEWVKIRNGSGAVGYCKLTGISNSDPNNLSETVYVSKNRAAVYAKPGTAYRVLGRMNRNAKLTAIAKTPDGKWYRVKNGSRTGYIQAANISASKQEGSTVYIISNTLKAYKSKSTSSKVLGVMTYGESMRLLSSSGEWAKIRNSSGATGYCKLSGLSSKNPNTLDSTVFVMVDKTPVYAKPGTNYRVLGRMSINSTLTALAKTSDGRWYRVKKGNRIGYIAAANVW